MDVKVFGSGCTNCHALQKRTTKALHELGIDGEVELVTDYARIAALGLMKVPAVVVDDQVVVSGRVPKVKELVTLLGSKA